VALGASFHKLLLIADWMPRSCNIRLSVALSLEKRNKAAEWFDRVFLDDDLHFLENHLVTI
jgi:hypothetical protein